MLKSFGYLDINVREEFLGEEAEPSHEPPRIHADDVLEW